MSVFRNLLIQNALKSEQSAINYYSFMTEVNGQYYLDTMPEVGDTALNIYDADLSLVATDGVCSMATIVSTDYLMVHSATLNLDIFRWSDNNDIINIVEPVASIYFDGESYVDTGYKPTADSIVVVEFNAEEITDYNQYVFGSQYSSGSLTKYACYIEANTGYLVGNYSDTEYFYLTIYSVIGQDISLSFSGTETTINGSASTHTVNDLSVNDNGHTNHNIYLGALDQNNAVLSGTGFKGTISSFKIYEGTEIDFDLEVEDGRFHDNVDGLYYDLQTIT